MHMQFFCAGSLHREANVGQAPLIASATPPATSLLTVLLSTPGRPLTGGAHCDGQRLRIAADRTRHHLRRRPLPPDVSI
jgi:hypothetical protein